MSASASVSVSVSVSVCECECDVIVIVVMSAVMAFNVLANEGVALYICPGAEAVETARLPTVMQHARPL